MIERPTEVITAAVGSIVGAILIVYGATLDGIDFNDLTDPEVSGAITILVSWVAWAVTMWVAAKQKAGDLLSGSDGKVIKAT